MSYVFQLVEAKPMRAIENPSRKNVVLPASVPGKQHLPLLSFLPLTVEGEIVGGMAVYDDATRERPADYAELYNAPGELVGRMHTVILTWFRLGGDEIAILGWGCV